MAMFLSLLPTLLTILAPLVTAGVKKLAPSVPKVLVPLTSVAVGTAGAVVADYLTGANLGPLTGAVAGAVGVAVREVVDQVKKALADRV